MDIRAARREDREKLSELWLAFMEEQGALEPRFGRSSDALERWRNDFPLWLRDDTRRLFVVEAEGEVVGFASAQRWVAPPIYAADEEVYLNELYVRPGKRRQQFGAHLVDAVKAWAQERGARRLRLGVLAANETGREFWEAQAARLFSLEYTIELDPSSSESPKKKRGRLGF